MLTTLKNKVRAIVQDSAKTDYENFTYTNSKIFDISESNITEVTKITKNGTELGSGEYTYDSVNKQIEITVSLNNGDEIIVYFKATEYSDTELEDYITHSLVWISIFAHEDTDYEIEDNDIYPTPDNKTLDLIALISGILIKPDYNQYVLPNIRVVYNNKLSKEERIEKLITRYQIGLGVTDIIDFDK